MLKNFQVVVFILFVSSFTIQSCKSDSTNKPTETETIDMTENPKSEVDNQKYILFFGNSLTAGYGLEEEESFPFLIQQRLDSLRMPYVVVNAGLSGETTSGGLARIDWILKQPIDVFVLELGANDVLRGLELTATKENLQGILDKVKSTYPEAKLVLAGMQAPPNMGKAYTTEFAKIFEEIAQHNNITLIPFILDGIAGIPDLNQGDGIHPNADGEKILMENVWEVLRTVL